MVAGATFVFASIAVSAYLTGAKSTMSPTTTEAKHTNHLAGQTSPYLLQHQHNPVNWYPWGEEALAKAREGDKPIFLSVGYSACHWCHVMEHESFENEEVAAILNERFINVKVDREERPDLDEIYMTATQMLTGSGGWPMSVFLTPDLQPFYAGTYFPPEDYYGRPGFKKLILTLAEAYRSRRDEVEKSAKQIAGNIEHYLAADLSAATVERDLVRRTVESLKQRFDPVWGGVGGAPKFPHTMDLMLAMRHYKATGDEETLEAVTHSLDKMARGGMYDQLGGGFHRYSVDAQWLIPHFEKMLYDNALLSRTYLEGYQLTGNEFYARNVRETLDYVVREMQSPEGGYYSSTDADSEGEEGKYFVWDPQEIHSILGEEDGKVFCAYYDVTEEGNFEHGKSALWLPKDPETVAEERGLTLDRLEQVIARSRPRLLEERAKRVPPGLDDKVLTDWNGLMISGMAFGAFVLDEPRYLESAERAAEAILGHQWNGERLLHTRRDGKSHLEGMQSDYANLVMGLVDLYLVSTHSRWLQKALDIHKTMVAKFSDPEKGGYFNTLAGQEDLIVRTKTGTDNAVPSGNSIAALNSLRFAALTGLPDYEKEAEKTILAFGDSLERGAIAHPMMMNALDYFYHGGEELVLAIPEGESATGFLDPLRKRFSPYLVWIAAERESPVPELAAMLGGKDVVEGKATAYLCRDRKCLPPTTDPKEILERLK